jgi:predicted anti-sigma-YlaC factor YlaD
MISRHTDSRMPALVLLLSLSCILTAGCSIRSMAVNKLGDALSSGGSAFASDNDPELIKAAVPFSLKMMESLLAESPRHRGLLLAASSGFTQYAYAFVQQEADEAEEKDWDEACRLRSRARLLYLRARDYGLRGLEVNHQGFGTTLREKPKEAVQSVLRDDVPLLYWTAASWAAAISLSKNDPDLVADLPFVEALIDRALELDEAFDAGAIHTFLISYEPARQGGTGDAAARSRAHFNRAMELSRGMQAGPLVALAEAVSVGRQDRAEFESLLNRALAVDVDARPEWRLTNLIMQRRARWLLSRTDKLFYGSGQPMK